MGAEADATFIDNRGHRLEEPGLRVMGNRLQVKTFDFTGGCYLWIDVPVVPDLIVVEQNGYNRI